LYQTADSTLAHSLIHSFDPSTAFQFLPINIIKIIIGGCLCDYRRAVVAISIIYIVRYIIWIILAVTGATLFGLTAANQENLNTSDEDQTTLVEGTVGLAAISVVAAVLLCCNIFQLVAALRYSVCMLGFAAFTILCGFGWTIYDIFASPSSATGSVIGSIISAIIAYGLALYPVVGLISEIKSGVMSKETYPREGM
jgi:hypothetical protein